MKSSMFKRTGSLLEDLCYFFGCREMVKETGSINRSLFALGKVISALGEGRSKKDTFVPYRCAVGLCLLLYSFTHLLSILLISKLLIR
jgi:hypothetical protein